MHDDAREKRAVDPGPPHQEDLEAIPTDDAPDTYEDMARAKRGNLLGRMNQAFQDALQNSRGPGRVERMPVAETREEVRVTADDLAIRRARTVRAERLLIPEGVIIDGSLTSGAETEIGGRVDGNVTVDGPLQLEHSALISGSVRAVTCRINGLVEGKVECSTDFHLGESGRLNADVMAGKAARSSW